MIQISKELMSEVLNLNITYIERCNTNIVYKISVYDREEEINIYELAYKCKEWALSKDYWTNSGYDNSYYCMLKDMPDNKWFYADTEVEAIIKACTYILNNLSNK